MPNGVDGVKAGRPKTRRQKPVTADAAMLLSAYQKLKLSDKERVLSGVIALLHQDKPRAGQPPAAEGPVAQARAALAAVREKRRDALGPHHDEGLDMIRSTPSRLVPRRYPSRRDRE